MHIYRHFRPFIEDHFPDLSVLYETNIIAHPSAEKTLSEQLTKKNGRVLYAVGPEGGWVEYEIEKFKEAGMHSFGMGSRILKVDTAVVSIHGRIIQVLENRKSES